MATWKNVVPAANQQFERKREVLLREASASFNHRGYHGTSLTEIATKLGVTKAALYTYVPSKEELLSFIRLGRVVDEYGESIDTEQFIEMALNWDGIIFDEAYEKEQSLKSGYLPHGSKYHDKIIDGLRVSSSPDFC